MAEERRRLFTMKIPHLIATSPSWTQGVVIGLTDNVSTDPAGQITPLLLTCEWPTAYYAGRDGYNSVTLCNETQPERA